MTAMVMCGAMALYVWTAWPSVATGDSGELITAAFHLGIAHPPGYPLYVILTKFMTVIVPFGSVAFRANMGSAVMTSAAIGMVAALGRGMGWPPFMAASVACVGAVMTTLWSQAILAEVYALHTALTAALLLGVVRYRGLTTHSTRATASSRGPLLRVVLSEAEPSRRTHWGVPRALPVGGPTGWWMTAFCAGLLLANHHTALMLVAPVLGWMAWRTRPPASVIVVAGVIVMLSLSWYLEMPLRSLAHPVADWGHPDTWSGMRNVLLRKQYGSLTTAPRTLAMVANQSMAYGSSLLSQGPWIWWVGAIVGIGALARARAFGWTVFVVGACTTGLGVWWGLNPLVTPHMTNLLNEFMAPSYLLWLIIVGAGWVWISTHFHRAMGPIVVCAMVMWHGIHVWPRVARADGWWPHEYGMNVLSSLPPRAWLFASGDTSAFVVAYLQDVEGWRRDITAADDTGTVLTNIYGQDFYTLSGPRHAARLEEVQREVAADVGAPVTFMPGAWLHNAEGITYRPQGLVYEVNSNEQRATSNELTQNRSGFFTHHSSLINHHSQEASSSRVLWRRMMWRARTPRTWREGEYLERDLMALVALARAEDALVRLDRSGAERWLRTASWWAYDIDAVRTSLAAIAMKKGFPEFAADEAAAAASLAPLDPDALNSVGAAWLAKGQPARAVEVFQQVILMKPDLVAGYNNLAIACLEVGRWGEAEGAAREGLRRRPDDGGLARHLGVALLKQNKHVEAQSVLSAAAERSPRDADIAFQLGNAWLRTADLGRAASSFARALELKPDFPVAANNLGVVYGQQGRHQDAIAAYRRAIRLDPGYVEAMSNLGGAYYNVGDRSEAVHWWQETLRRDPSHSQAKRYLAEAEKHHTP